MAASRPAAALNRLRDDAAGCRDCPLWRDATQTVFGEGAPGAQIMLVGEQPGDREDLQGKPFVGPAGMLLDRALTEAGIERSSTYTTNAVKHFKYLPRRSCASAAPRRAMRRWPPWWPTSKLRPTRPKAPTRLAPRHGRPGPAGA
jgi:uracil-DNA glycosylase